MVYDVQQMRLRLLRGRRPHHVASPRITVGVAERHEQTTCVHLGISMSIPNATGSTAVRVFRLSYKFKTMSRWLPFRARSVLSAVGQNRGRGHKAFARILE
ncbi:hypothetical protein ACLKA6_019808 [Drosophila palustris]